MRSTALQLKLKSADFPICLLRDSKYIYSENNQDKYHDKDPRGEGDHVLCKMLRNPDLLYMDVLCIEKKCII